MICGPGGHIERGETPEQAAIRETKEEFDITPVNLMSLGQLGEFDNPHIFVCTEFEGEPKCDGEEMTGAEWRDIGELGDNLFPPFHASLAFLETEAPQADGGPGSGNFGHLGDPPHVGGAGEGKDPENDPSEYDWERREGESSDDHFDRISGEAERLGVKFDDVLMILAGANPFRKRTEKSPWLEKVKQEMEELHEARVREGNRNLIDRPLPGLEGVSPKDQFRILQYHMWEGNSRERFSGVSILPDKVWGSADYGNRAVAEFDGINLTTDWALESSYEYSPDIVKKMEAMANVPGLAKRESQIDFLKTELILQDWDSAQRTSVNEYIHSSDKINEFLSKKFQWETFTNIINDLEENDEFLELNDLWDNPIQEEFFNEEQVKEFIQDNPEFVDEVYKLVVSPQVDALDTVIENFDLKGPVVARRRISLRSLGGEPEMGGVISSPVFSSTSVMATPVSQIRYGSDNVEMVISIPPGKGRGAYVSHKNTQREFLLKRNAKFMVTNYDPIVPRVEVVMIDE
jgi:hypothetical protein